MCAAFKLLVTCNYPSHNCLSVWCDVTVSASADQTGDVTSKFADLCELCVNFPTHLKCVCPCCPCEPCQLSRELPLKMTSLLYVIVWQRNWPDVRFAYCLSVFRTCLVRQLIFIINVILCQTSCLLSTTAEDRSLCRIADLLI